MKILIVGASGQLGQEFQRRLKDENIPFLAADRTICDITKPDSIERVIEEYKPTSVINCAAYNLVDQAEDERTAAFAVNAEAVKNLAVCCGKRNLVFVHYSTDYVFDGKKKSPYVETDVPHPLSVYAESKLAGETYTQSALKDYLIFRVSWVIGPGNQNFLYKLRQWMEKTDTLRISEDEFSVPTFASTIVEVTLLAIKAELKGLYHLTNSGFASRYELAKEYLNLLGTKNKNIIPVPSSTFSLKAKRPGYSVMVNDLLSEKLRMKIPDWRADLKNYVKTSMNERRK